MTPLDPRSARRPADARDPGYPPLFELPLARREALRVMLLGALSGLGLPLIGCPSSPAGGGGGGGGGGGENTDWIPWRDEPTRPPLAGAPPPQPMGPVAVVIGGGPVAVTFQDGREAHLAVALVVSGPGAAYGVDPLAPGPLEAVKAVAKGLPGSVLDSADGLAQLEQALLEEIGRREPALTVEGTQVSPALTGGGEPGADQPPEAPSPPAQAPARSSAPAPSAPAAAPPPPMAPPDEAAAPAPPVKPAARPRAALWIPCSKPGCTSCGKR